MKSANAANPIANIFAGRAWHDIIMKAYGINEAGLSGVATK